MKTKGFLLLESISFFLIGMLLLLTCLHTYNSCLKLMQKKLYLEEAITVAELFQAGRFVTSHLQTQECISEKAAFEGLGNLQIKEVQVIHNGKIIFTLAAVQ